MHRELILMRHAKSAWPLGVPDDLRPLNDRGRTDAAALAPDMATLGQIDEVLYSPAVRTTSTAQLALADLDLTRTRVDVAPDLYEATTDDVLRVVHEIDEDVRRALIVGHNPSMAEAALLLAGDAVDHEELRTIALKFPTLGLAVLTSTDEWSAWGANCATLLTFTTPKDRARLN